MDFNSYSLPSLEKGLSEFKENFISQIIFKEDGNVNSLVDIFSFKIETGRELSVSLPVGTTFELIFANQNINDFATYIQEILFEDATNSKFNKYNLLAFLTGCISPQIEDNKMYFNSNGVVTVAELLDGLNAIYYGINANNIRKKTADNLSWEVDYFNEGYQLCCQDVNSPFFSLYERAELITPVTRIELAYITVMCWEKFGSVFNDKFGVGYTFSWGSSFETVRRYEDCMMYEISTLGDISTLLDIRNYRSDRTMLEFREAMILGRVPIPLPMFMSLVELGEMDLFYFENLLLKPLDEVTREEYCYFIVNLAKKFS